MTQFSYNLFPGGRLRVIDMDSSFSSRFDAVAAEYDHAALRGMAASARRLVELADLTKARLIVDVGTGTGHAAIAAAVAVPDARIVGLDPSNGMREQAARKIRSLGISNVELRDGDALALPFADNSVEAIICASAIYTLRDIPAALREWRRALRPGARLAFSALRVGANNLYFDLLEQHGIPVRANNPLERVNTAEKCARLLEEAEFLAVSACLEQLGYFVATAEESWALIWNTGARIPLTYLPQPVVKNFKSTYLATMEKARRADGIWIDWPAVFALGTKG